MLVAGVSPAIPGGNFARRGLSCAFSEAFRLRSAFGDAAFATGLLVAIAGDEWEAETVLAMGWFGFWLGGIRILSRSAREM